MARPSALAATLAVAAVAGCRPSPAVPDAPPVVLRTYVLADPPPIGEAEGVRFFEGGFSGLDRLPDGTFVAVSDRGPNAEAIRHPSAGGQPVKVFPFPEYAPALFFLRPEDAASGGGGRLVIRRVVRLARPDGSPTRGLPPPADEGAAAVERSWADLAGTELPRDPWGIDAESVAAGPDGTFWVGDEYRPSLWHVDGRTGRVLARYTPNPTGAPEDRPLPSVLHARRPNWGFEGLAVRPDGRVVAALQGPLDLPTPEATRGTRVSRLLVLDPATGQSVTYAFALDGPDREIGDVAALDDDRLLLIEHGPMPDGAWAAHVYLLDLDAAAPVPDGLAPETEPTPEAAQAAGARLAPKTLVLDLLAAGWDPEHEKPEGLAVVDARTLAIVNDNDYGLTTPDDDGVFVPNGVRTTLYVFTLPEGLAGR